MKASKEISQREVTQAATTEPPDHGDPAARRRYGMLVAGVLLLGCAAAFAGVMRADLAHPPVAGLDHDWLSLVASTRTATLTDLFKALSVAGGPVGATIIVAVLCVALLVAGRWRTALYLALAEASGSACSQLVKHAVLRNRPPHPLVTADLGSFPSGHVITTLGVGLALTVAFARPGHRRYPLAAVAAATALMMFGRTYLAAHWLTDTLESLPIAAGLGLILWWIFDPLLARDRNRPLRPTRTLRRKPVVINPASLWPFRETGDRNPSLDPPENRTSSESRPSPGEKPSQTRA